MEFRSIPPERFAAFDEPGLVKSLGPWRPSRWLFRAQRPDGLWRLVERTRKLVDPTKAVLLIRPSWTVAREGSLMAFFGVTCKGGEGNLRVRMTFASPTHDGDKVTIGGVDGY